MVFQQGEVEAVLAGAADAPAFLDWLHLHQGAMGMVDNHKTLPTVQENEVSCHFWL